MAVMWGEGMLREEEVEVLRIGGLVDVIDGVYKETLRSWTGEEYEVAVGVHSLKEEGRYQGGGGVGD